MDTANQILVIKSVWPALILEWGRTEVLVKSRELCMRPSRILLIVHTFTFQGTDTSCMGLRYRQRRRAIVLCQENTCFLPKLAVEKSGFLVFCAESSVPVGLAPYNYLVSKFWARSCISGKTIAATDVELQAIAVSSRASAAVVDVLIAMSMVYLLLKAAPEPQTHFTRTRKLVFSLVLISVNSGAWTAILALLDLICPVLNDSQMVAFPTAFTFCIFELPLCSLYMSTLLANLNARKWINTRDQKTISLRGSRAEARVHSIFFLDETSHESAVHSLDDRSAPFAKTKILVHIGQRNPDRGTVPLKHELMTCPHPEQETRPAPGLSWEINSTSKKVIRMQ
ncbi:hypothetical protein C8J57DRAFT_1222357 [Mycena rebaudengoi]|nr:hypothetical protein C8J57DRAFT_1222357 [Mycena rebaudengoi]